MLVCLRTNRSRPGQALNTCCSLVLPLETEHSLYLQATAIPRFLAQTHSAPLNSYREIWNTHGHVICSTTRYTHTHTLQVHTLTCRAALSAVSEGHTWALEQYTQRTWDICSSLSEPEQEREKTPSSLMSLSATDDPDSLETWSSCRADSYRSPKRLAHSHLLQTHTHTQIHITKQQETAHAFIADCLWTFDLFSRTLYT